MSDLQARVESRKRELISELVEHKKNSSRFGAADEVTKLKARLDELANIVKGVVGSGWANVAPSARVRLDAWMAR
jgi:hypothetical protein